MNKIFFPNFCTVKFYDVNFYKNIKCRKITSLEQQILKADLRWKKSYFEIIEDEPKNRPQRRLDNS